MNISSEFISQSVFRINENLPRIEKCLNLISEDQVWLKPNSSTNSIANLILHLNGNIAQYINSALGNEPDNRQRDLEFSKDEGFTKEILTQQFKSVISKSVLIIENLTDQELLKEHWVQGFRLTGMNIIIHVVEHLSYHTGQIALQTKLITNQDLGFYADMDLNQNNK